MKSNKVRLQNTLVLAGAILAGLLLARTELYADGCYICEGQPNTYVKFTGADSGAKRSAAQNCGCTVAGTTGSCNAANYRILCTVRANVPGTFQMASKALCTAPGS